MEDGADAVEVGAEVVILVLDYFRSHVVGTAAMAIRIVGLCEVALAQSEVPDVKVTIDVDEYVLGLS